MSVPHAHAAQGELVDAVVLVVREPGADDGVPGPRATPQSGFGSGLVPVAREVPYVLQLGLGVTFQDRVVQERLDERR
ncbi:hypothetical protein ACFQ7O_19820 [Streptomyces sp. NPDC056485]|uniref:hypothetical protein n=1 Tax=Streptomyces sp. NPDC056485 TaxID=3345834 RepID=UPI0036BAC94F